MSDFKTKMHQIQFRLGFRQRPCWEAYSARPYGPLAGFKGPTSKGKGKERVDGGEESLYFILRIYVYVRHCRWVWSLISTVATLTRSSANAEEPCEHTVSWNRVKCYTDVEVGVFEGGHFERRFQREGGIAHQPLLA